jgi:hypothetical protein
MKQALKLPNFISRKLNNQRRKRWREERPEFEFNYSILNLAINHGNNKQLSFNYKQKVLDQKWEWVEVKVVSLTQSTWKIFPVY